jgi:hypothetical protein
MFKVLYSFLTHSDFIGERHAYDNPSALKRFHLIVYLLLCN